MNTAEISSGAPRKRHIHKDGKRKEYGNSIIRRKSIATGRDGNRQNAGRIVGKTSKKSRSDEARSSKISGGAKNIKDSGRTQKK